MKREDLFAAIGQVESSRLARSELEMTNPSPVEQEEPNMTKKRITTGRIIRNILAAAIILSMLGVTAYAVAGYVIFDSPQDMLTSIFGDQTGYDHKDVTHWTDPEKPGEIYDNPAYDRVPVDEEVMQSEAAPLVSPVGQSISWKGYTLTVDANMYDKVTKCGLLTYTIENPDGLPHYEVDNNGKIWFPGGEILDVNQYGYSYIIKDQSTESKLTATFYYQLANPNSDTLELSICQWAIITTDQMDSIMAELTAQAKQEVTPEDAVEMLKTTIGTENYETYAASATQEQLEDAAYFQIANEKFNERYQCPDKITIPENAQGEMSSITLADGKIKVSPIAICVDTTDMQDYPNGYIAVTKIRFQDGTEYLVRDDNTANYMFAVGNTDRDVTFMFNRMIDVNEISSVILDGGLEFPVN